MNLNGDEEKIQRLFRELSFENLRQTPQFARVIEAASSRSAKPKNKIRPMRLAVGAAAVIAIVLLAALALRRPSEIEKKGAEQAQSVPGPQSERRLISPDQVASRPESKPRTVRRVRHRRPVSEPAIDVKLLFAWQSPTASLLKSNTADLLMTLPRLGESLETIRSFSPDLWN
jgi:hypothetical protein